MGPADHYLSPAHRALWFECPSEEYWHFRLLPVWVQTSWPNPRPRPSVLPKIWWETPANMATWCWSGNHAVGLGRGPVHSTVTAGFVASTGLKIWPAWLLTVEEEGSVVAVLISDWWYRVSARTSWPSDSKLWLGEIASLICIIYHSVSVLTNVQADLSLSYKRKC